MKNFYRLLLLLPALLLALVAPAQTCQPTPNSGAGFKVVDASTGEDLTVLCEGRPVRFEDTSGRQLDPRFVLYAIGPAITCKENDLRVDNVVYTPTAADATQGFVVITQNTQQPGGAAGIIFSLTRPVKPTPKPEFTVAVCSPGFVEVTIIDRIYADNLYSVQIGNATYNNVDRSQPRSYLVPAGATTVTVTGSHAGADACSNSDTKTFAPLPTPRRPLIERMTVRDGNLDFDLADLQPEYEYELQLAEATAPDGYRTVARFSGARTTNFYSLSNAPIPGCYSLRVASACQANTNVGLPRSFQICTVNLGTVSLTTTSNNGQNKLTWTTDDLVSTFTVRRNERILDEGILPGDAREFVDTTASCGTTYTYRITAQVDRTASVSNPSSVVTAAGRSPLAPRLVASFTLSNNVELFATNAGGVPLPNELTFLRTSPTLTELGVVNAPTLTDSPTNLSVTNPPCYLARRRDACGSVSGDSNPACPVVLAVDPQPEGARFTWSALGAPDPAIPVSYRLVRIALNGATIDAIPVSGLSYVDTQPPTDQSTVRYRIEATGGGLATASYSNLLNVTRQPTLVMPTAFSPNGDGLNDVLEVKGRFLTTFTFTVIDRNGQEVFRGTNRTQTWDGRINGRAPVPGAYAWRFEAPIDNGQRFVQHGAITIVR